MADKQYSVYYLSDPTTNQVRYVGCSCRPSARFEFHLEARGESHRARWIRKLLEVSLSPVFTVKCVVQTEEEMFRIEMALIAKLREKDEPLTNMTAGGDGLINPLPEVRAKRSAAQLGNTRFAGHIHSEDTKRRMRESRARILAERPEIGAGISERNKGNTWGALISAEARQTKSNAMLGNTRAEGHVHTEEWRTEQSARLLGNKSRTGMTNSDESNEQRSVSCSAFWTEERRAEKAVSQTGKTHSEETKARCAASAKAMWARRKAQKET